VTRFVDVDVHPPTGILAGAGFLPFIEGGDLPDGPATMEGLADYYRRRDAVALVHAFDAGSVVGATALSNRRLAEAIEPHRDVIVGLACVDPHRGEAAVVEAHDALRLGLRGLYLHPPAQQFDPIGRRFAAVWELAEELRFPVVVHCGTTVLGAGRPGGMGVALDVADPMRMDRVASTRPGLQIVLTGITPPWEEAAVAVAAHKQNVHLALSGRTPAEMGRVLAEAVTGPLAAKSMLASGFPFHTPDAWLEQWDGLEPAGDADRAVRLGNAAALFRL
jgi:predicted TIM-barrel fold metal-dependent hydrolase